MKVEQEIIFLNQRMGCWIVLVSGMASFWFVTPVCAVPYLSYRSQGTSLVRELSGIELFINRYGLDHCYGTVTATYERTATFASEKIARSLFGGDVITSGGVCAPTIRISGSRAAGRQNNDWLADYFGLPSDFVSALTIEPSIKNNIVDLTFYSGLDTCCQGLYLQANVPITCTRWNLHAQEDIIDAGQNGYDFGYYSPNYLERRQLLNSALNFLNGSQALYLPITLNDAPLDGNLAEDFLETINYYPTDTQFLRLAASKWPATSQTFNQGLGKAGVADVELILGYNIVNTHDALFGVNVRATCPTGNRPTGEYMFEPVVGNGGSWELGGGLSALYTFWHGYKNNRSCGFYVDAAFTHLFNAHQRRVFDVRHNGPNSRYMLAQQLTTLVVPQLYGESSLENGTDGDMHDYAINESNPVVAVYNNLLAPVADLTWSRVKVHSAIQADVMARLVFFNGTTFSGGIGYDFWGRSKEVIKRVGAVGCADPLTSCLWALKGDAYVYAYNENNNLDYIAVPISATESKATIHNGTNDFLPGLSSLEDVQKYGVTQNFVQDTNPGIDNPEYGIDSFGGVQYLVNWLESDPTHVSVQPVPLTVHDLDVCGARGISHTAFGYITYEWQRTPDDRWSPFLGIGLMFEISHNRYQPAAPPLKNNPDPIYVPCKKVTTAVNQWGAWIKGGVNFD